MRAPAAVALAALALLARAPGPEGVAMKTAPDSVSLELVLPRSIKAGRLVPIRLRVQNRTREPVDLYLRGRTPTFDVVVARKGGEVVWRRLENEIVPAILQLRTLGPAERLELEAVWDQRTSSGRPAEPGEYTARGLLLTEGEPMEAPAEGFRIVGR